jgi:CDP-glucose 4,6-dehydratase
MKLHKKQKFIHNSWNFGPNNSNNKSVNFVINLINKEFNNSVSVIKKNNSMNKHYESKLLMLNSEKSKKILHWKPKYDLKDSIRLVSSWHKNFLAKKNVLNISQKQIIDYLK